MIVIKIKIICINWTVSDIDEIYIFCKSSYFCKILRYLEVFDILTVDFAFKIALYIDIPLQLFILLMHLISQ